jgi:hypothetical protein
LSLPVVLLALLFLFVAKARRSEPRSMLAEQSATA